MSPLSSSRLQRPPTLRESGHFLSNNRCRDWGLDRGSWDSTIAINLSLAAIAGDVASLATAVAGLASSVERAAVGCSAVTGNVTQFATGVALHGLSLAIPSKVVWSTALVAGSRTRAASKGAPSAKSTECAAGRTCSSASHASSSAGIGAVAGQVASQATAIASSAGSSSAQAQSRAISLRLSDMHLISYTRRTYLNVSEALAVVALLRLGSARMRASIGLVARLLAVIAKPLRGRAHL
jgi:hypothetical protein